MIDTALPALADRIYDIVRQYSNKPVCMCIYTHGHNDHASFDGLPFEQEQVQRGEPRTDVIGHVNVVARFDRYQLTAGYNEYINTRQFQRRDSRGMGSIRQFRYPDTTYKDRLHVFIGGEELELIHAKGETDDATIIWSAKRKMLWPGDFWIWNVPNCGNPQKVQRYPLEWSAALKMMARLGAETVFPGHGPPIFGTDHIRQAFLETAAFLDSIVRQALDGINAGLTLNQVLHKVVIPDQTQRVYLRHTYDDPRFIVSNIWRLYAGAWDQDPAHLLPPKKHALAAEVSKLAGGALLLAERAANLADTDIAMAVQLAEWAGEAAPESVPVHTIRAAIYNRCRDAEKALMTQSIFRDAEAHSVDIIKAPRL